MGLACSWSICQQQIICAILQLLGPSSLTPPEASPLKRRRGAQPPIRANFASPLYRVGDYIFKDHKVCYSPHEVGQPFVRSMHSFNSRSSAGGNLVGQLLGACTRQSRNHAYADLLFGFSILERAFFQLRLFPCGQLPCWEAALSIIEQRPSVPASGQRPTSVNGCKCRNG